MTADDVKMIILDLDGTLYDINDVIGNVYNYQVMFLSSKLNKTSDDIKTYFESHGIYSYVTKESKSATELFEQLGISKEEWKTYRNTHFDVKTIQKGKAVGESSIRSLGTNHILVLLSSNTMATIEKILSHIGIPKDLFFKIICSDSFSSKQGFNKKKAMEYLAAEEDIPFCSMLSIGDRYLTDIKPMTTLGGTGILLQTPKALEKVAKDIEENNLMSCNEYELY